MKKILPLLSLLAMLILALPSYSQKYKTVDDTLRLSQEYVRVSNDIADLTNKIAEAESDLQSYKSKASNADNDAARAATASSNQADKATNGSVGSAKSAKRKAKKAYKEAKDSQYADKRVGNQADKLSHYQKDLKKKQDRLQELDEMRAKIMQKS
jgi:chromosome segregation ATPase